MQVYWPKFLLNFQSDHMCHQLVYLLLGIILLELLELVSLLSLSP